MAEYAIENKFIEFLVRDFIKSPWQINNLQESDAELIQIPGTEIILAITTDSINEEIETGLYSEAYLIGWMTVMVNASDLAAVGAEPLGILLNETIPDYLEESLIRNLQNGIKDASEFCKLPVLGGDTNRSSVFQMGGTAIGMINRKRLLTRVGCQPGDILFISEKPGSGNSYAFSILGAKASGFPPSVCFKPYARQKEGMILLDFATCCMDTSDGFFSTLDQLMLLNNRGFLLDLYPQDFIHPETLDFANSLNIPPWMFLAGIHGEFELIFTVPPGKVPQFLERAQISGWSPVKLGSVISKPELQMKIYNVYIKIDTCWIRNLFDATGGDIQKYIGELIKIDRKWKS